MQQSKILDNYFLLGRKLSLFPFIATLVSTWYGNLLGVSEIAFKHGIVAWLSQGIFWYLIYFIFIFFLVEKINKSKLLSIPDQMEKAYGKKTAIVTAIINILVMNPAVYLLSLGIIISQFIDIDRNLAILIGALIPLIYMLKGGFKAVIETDIIQFFLMFAGTISLIPFLINKYGGWEFLSQNLPSSHLELGGDWSWQLILAWFFIAFWSLADPNFYQRTYAAINSETAKKGIVISLIFWVVFDLTLNTIGLYAFAVMPEANASEAILLLANQTLPWFFKILFYLGIIATIMSTLDSLCFSSSMAISYDIVKRLKPEIKDNQIIKINKLALILVVLIGILISIFFKSLMDIMYIRGSLLVSSIIIPLLASYFIKIQNKNIAIYSIFAGISGLIVQTIMNKNQILEIEPILIGLLCSATVYLITWQQSR